MTPEALAAVELLAEHDHWLRVMAIDPSAWAVRVDQEPGGTYAAVDWRELHRRYDSHEIAGSSSQLSILMVACSLARTGCPVSLRDAVTGLGRVNAGLVADAVVRAAGHPVRHHQRAAVAR